METDEIYPQGKIITIPFEDPAFRTFGEEEFDFNWRLRQHNILAESVTTNKIADDAVNTDKIVDGAITADKIEANTITASEIYAGTITTAELNFTPYVIGTNDLDDVGDGTTYAKVLNADITAGHVLLSSTTGDLDDVSDGSTYGKVALTGITAGKIVVAGLDSGVTVRMFLDSTTKTNIEAWRHASDVTLIDGGDIYTNTITATQIAANTITATQIATDTITATQIAANTITATQIAASTITATEISTNTITTNQLKISDSGNTSEKLLIYQGSSVTELIDYKGTNVDHQITNWTYWPTLETNTFLSQAISDPAAGGIRWCALADAEVWAVWGVNAIMCADANTSKDGTASAVIVEEPLRGNPATHTYTNWNANANIWGIRTVPNGSGERMVFFVDEDGDYFYDGGGTAFQDEDDIQMVKDLEDILTDKISKSEMKKKNIYKKHKVVNVSEVYDKDLKKNRLDRYISGKKKDLLFMGAIRQLNEKIEVLEGG